MDSQYEKGNEMTNVHFNGIVQVIMTNANRQFIVETTFDELFIDNPDLEPKRAVMNEAFCEGLSYMVDPMVLIVPSMDLCT